MSYRRATLSSLGRLTFIVAAVMGVAAALGCLALWIAGLPGPHHGAYAAYASLVNIRSGLWSYDAQNGHLPAATARDVDANKSVSWRIEVYQQLAAAEEHSNASTKYDRQKEWDDPANLLLEGLGARFFRYTPVDVDVGRSTAKYGPHATYYKAISGADTGFSETPSSLRDLPENAILVVRVEQSDTHWMEPGDLTIEQLTPSDETKRLLSGKEGYAVLFADGEVWVLSGRTPISDLCKFLALSGARQFDREQLLGRFRVLP